MTERRAGTMEGPITKDTYDPQKQEPYWQNFWDKEGVYRFDPESPAEVYTIDTPPPTISGRLHLGHVYSYTQVDPVARFHRMAGHNVRYPMGRDDNGLPTERLVEKERGIDGRRMPIGEFNEICLQVVREYGERYRRLWNSLGLSVDWGLEYSSISPESQRFAQTVFKELYDRGVIYRKEAIALYCWKCHTSIAQAEVEDSEMPSVFYDIAFKVDDGDELVVATTRPELLPACVAVFVHPDDDRYKAKVGKTVSTPLGEKVQILADGRVSKEKGTGAVMCCTYGDETDLEWVREYGLPERVILTKEGRTVSLDDLPESSSKSIMEARKATVLKLGDLGAIRGERKIDHSVGVHERCGTPIELLPTKQWFMKIIEQKDALLEAGRRIRWHPSYMQGRYEQWVSGLEWDWCISRERIYGIPIPAYTCSSCDHIHVPDADTFPVDPRTDAETLPCPSCGEGKLIPDGGVFDTWFTSASTPDINNDFPANGRLTGKLYPMSVRPLGHDIIRTWVTYSILMAHYRHQEVPWKDLMVSGHILLRKGEKISKRTGGGDLRPEDIIKQHSADAVRYAMYGAELGRDGYFDEGEVKKGRRLATKLFNAGRLVVSNLQDFKEGEIEDEAGLETIDRWIVARSRATAQKMAREFESFRYSRARQIFEDFFWGEFCDNYLEIVKGRLYGAAGSSETRRASAQYALYHGYLDILKMVAPFLPHIAEQMYHADLSAEGTVKSESGSGLYAAGEGQKSIHLTSWPSGDSSSLLTESESQGLELMLEAIRKVRVFKTQCLAVEASRRPPMPSVVIEVSREKRKLLEPFLEDLIFVTKAEGILVQGEDADDTAGKKVIEI